MSAESLARIYGTEEDRVNCPFFFKIGACRHGDRCSRNHNRPHFSQTLLIPHMYNLPPVNPLTGQSVVNEKEHLTDFCEEVIDELATYGCLEEFHIVANLGEHMLGNVYLKYASEEEAEKALKSLNGRYYAGRQLTCEYSPVTDFRESRCRQYDEETCNRGGFCFPAVDTRVLTDRGFLFLDEILAIQAEGTAVQFACFDPTRKMLLYRPGGLLIKEHDGELVDMTHVNEQRRWSGDDFGDDESNDDRRSSRTNHLSLRVTPDHDLYAELGRRAGDEGQANYKGGYSKLKASELHSDDPKDCVRQLAFAANGVQGDALGMEQDVSTPLGLSSPAQLEAFLELYGFWLGDGSMSFAMHGRQGVRAIMFDQIKSSDIEWLLETLPKTGLTGADWWSYKTKRSTRIYITRASWVSFFSAEYHSKYKYGSAFSSASTSMRSTPASSRSPSPPRKFSASDASTPSSSSSMSGRPSAELKAMSDADEDSERVDREYEEAEHRFIPGSSVSKSASRSLISFDEPEHDFLESPTSPINARERDEVNLISDDEMEVSPAPVRVPSSSTSAAASSTPVVSRSQEEGKTAALPLALVDDSEVNVKSVKWFFYWVRRCCSRDQLRLVVRGLQRADGAWAMQQKRIYTSGVTFRDALVAVLYDAGYSAFFERQHAVGDVKGYTKYEDGFSTVVNKRVVDSLTAAERAEYMPIKATQTGWRVNWTEPVGTALAKDMCSPSMNRSDVRLVPFKGTVWCVDVEHDAHLVVAQRAHRDAKAVVTKASRPIIVGNCNFMHMRPLPSAVRKELERVRERGRRRRDRSRSRERSGRDRDRDGRERSSRDDRGGRESKGRDDRKESAREDKDVRVPSSSSSSAPGPVPSASGRSSSEERRAKIAEWNRARDAKKAAEEGQH